LSTFVNSVADGLGRADCGHRRNRDQIRGARRKQPSSSPREVFRGDYTALNW
jgi:hypothetical protein